MGSKLSLLYVCTHSTGSWQIHVPVTCRDHLQGFRFCLRCRLQVVPYRTCSTAVMATLRDSPHSLELYQVQQIIYVTTLLEHGCCVFIWIFFRFQKLLGFLDCDRASRSFIFGDQSHSILDDNFPEMI